MGALQQYREGLKPDTVLLHPLRHKMPVRTAGSANERQRLHMAVRKTLWWEGLILGSRHVRLTPLARGGAPNGG